MKAGDQKRTIDVLIPGLLSEVRGALSSAALSGNQFAIDALETIRRAEAGEPVGAVYVERLNHFVSEHSPPVIRAHNLTKRQRQ